MKKITIIGLLMLMLMATSVMALTMPHPIYGKIIVDDGYPIEGLDVRVKNLDTGANAVTVTDDKGFYQVDLGNVDDRYHDGDVIQVSIVYCESLERCKSEVLVSGGGNQVAFSIEPTVEQPLPSTSTVIKYVCEDGSTVGDLSTCPVKEDNIDWSIVAAISIVIIGLGLSFAWASNNGVQAKWRWMPGMAGILKYHLKRYKELCQLGKKVEAKKKASTLLKYSKTITEKYLNKLLE